MPGVHCENKPLIGMTVPINGVERLLACTLGNTALQTAVVFIRTPED
jgi:hypothetical protein